MRSPDQTMTLFALVKMMEPAKLDNAWTSTLESRSPEAIAKARRLLDVTCYCSLSTCSSAGEPWASPLLFAYDRRWRFYWSSAVAAQHSQNIYQTGKAAIAIYASGVPQAAVEGLYLSGSAQELERDRAADIAALFDQRSPRPKPRSPQDYQDPSPRRFYQFSPEAVWITGDRLLYQDQLIDTKIRLDLESLVAAFETE